MEQRFTNRKLHFCYHRNFWVFYPKWKAPHVPRGSSGRSLLFFCALFSRPFRLSLAPTICPWVCEDDRTISKNSNGCRLLIGHKKTFVLLCPISEQHLLSSFRVFVHDGYYLTILVWFVHQACASIFARETFTFCFPKQKRRNYRWLGKTFQMTIPICTKKILLLTDHKVS